MSLAQIQSVIEDPEKLKEVFGSTPVLIGDIIVDVLLNEDPIYSWELTKHPVEAGLDITDSRYKKPVGVILDCIFVDPEFSITDIVGDIQGAVASSGTLEGSNPFAKATWQEKRDALKSLVDGNNFITITTPDDDYVSMMASDLKPIFGADKKNAYFFRLIAEKVVVATSDIVAVDDSQIPEDLKAKEDKDAKKKTAKKKNKGKEKVQTASEKKKSILLKLIGGLGG